MSTTLERLKASIENDIAPDDVIMGILSGLNENSIPKDPGVLHQAIYELKKKNDYNDLLNEFYFDTSGITPFSDLLDRVLFRLETANILVAQNPRYEIYEIKKERLKESIEKFPKNQQSVLLQMSKDFQGLLAS